MELFERLLALRNDVGLLSEEYDPRYNRQVGNFPQAFSHMPLIQSALNLARPRQQHHWRRPAGRTHRGHERPFPERRSPARRPIAAAAAEIAGRRRGGGNARLVVVMACSPHILVVNGRKVRQPVFVIGAPHSGTDLLARALKHSDGFHVTIGQRA